MMHDMTAPPGSAVSAADIAELDLIRAQFKAIAAQKLGLQGSRTFMDSGHEVASYPAGLRCEQTEVNGIRVEKVQANNDTRTACSILHCHGGGYTVGSVLSHRPLASRLSEATGCAVYTFNYRLAPEHRFPAALEDAVSVYSWLLQDHAPSSLVVSGDSAGGSLALALLLALRDRGLPQPKGTVGLSPWIDLACEGNTFQVNKQRDPAGNRGGLLMMAHAYAGKENLKHPLVSPLYADSLTGICPILLQAGTAETLLDDSRRFAEKAAREGIQVTLQEWPEMIHVWHSFYGRLPQASAALSAIRKWIDTLPAS